MTYATQVLAKDRVESMAWFNYAVKAALVVAFAVAIFVPLDVLEGKGIGARAPLFLAPAVVVPLLAKFRNWDPYPHTADAFLSLPFLLDTLGNVLGFYDRFIVTDDVLHTINWVFLVYAFHAFRFRNVFDRRDAVLLGYGFGALLIVLWEIFEWAISEDGWGGAGGLALTYGDTIGDLTLSSTGGLVGSIAGVLLLGPTARTKQRRAVADQHAAPV